MKKQTRLLCLLALAASTGAAGQTPFRTTRIALADSTKSAIVHIAADYPSEGDEPLLTNARRAILDHLGYPQQQPSPDAAQALRPVVNAYLKELHSSFEEFQAVMSETAGAGEPAAPDYHFTFEGAATVDYQTAKVLTYRYQAYTYSGGAHGLSSDLYYTLERPSGRALTWDDLFEPGEKRQQLAALVRAALAEQFYAPLGARPAFDEAPDLFSFALPQLPPAFVKGGVVFKYTSYEIDSYAAGMPECTLAYDVVAPYLTARAKALLP